MVSHYMSIYVNPHMFLTFYISLKLQTRWSQIDEPDASAEHMWFLNHGEVPVILPSKMGFPKELVYWLVV